ncbi:MAG: NAD(P)/FAD-dependent oxidoreductase [Chloroflexota bacterium]|nr:NAD(P)/FAD-dependent oxidoreductase [Chloroflexota bacterium]
MVVGAGTAGAYFAWRIAQAGFKTVVLEKQRLEELGTDIGILHVDGIRFAQFGIPLPTGNELVGYYPDGRAWPPDGDDFKVVKYAFYVIEKPLFIRRLQCYATLAGAQFIEQAAADDVIVEAGALAGLGATTGGGELEVRARLVVDCSGIDGAVRTRLPDDLCVENDPISDDDTLFVILQYWDDIEGDHPTGLNFYPFHKTFCNPSYGDGAILGIGQPGGYEQAERVHREFLAERFPNQHRLVKRCQGRTPFRRPPYSLVGNGFVVMGDAAFMTKPFSGEGVTSGFTACQIAAEVATAALSKGDVSRAALWPYNVRYFRDQGAKFAELLAQLPAAAELSRRDVNYLFKRDVIFSGEDFTRMNRDFEVQRSTSEVLSLAVKLVRGVISGQFSAASLKSLLGAMSVSGKLRAAYERYPETPAGFEAWVAEVRPLWEAVGTCTERSRSK